MVRFIKKLINLVKGGKYGNHKVKPLFITKCYNCNGTRKYKKRKCKYCKGTGKSTILFG